MSFWFSENGSNGDSLFTMIDKQTRKQFRRLIDEITGFPYHTLFLIWISMTFVFGLFYFILGEVPGQGPEQIEGMPPIQRLLNSFYYSVITATSTGYGDITPLGFSKFLASLQSILALFIFAVFVTKLVSRRQDIALRQIHKLAFEDAFHNIREGFFIVRNDFDSIIAKAVSLHKLSEDDWNDLTTAYRQAQSFLRRVPDFYDPDNRLYSLDIRREELLEEGLRRTIERVDHLVDVLSSKHIHWTSQNQSLEELREFLQLVNKITHFWVRQSPHKRTEAFENLLDLNDEVHRKVELAVARNGDGTR